MVVFFGKYSKKLKDNSGIVLNNDFKAADWWQRDMDLIY